MTTAIQNIVLVGIVTAGWLSALYVSVMQRLSRVLSLLAGEKRLKMA